MQHAHLLRGLVPALLVTALAAGCSTTTSHVQSSVSAETPKASAQQADFPLPPGWTQDDMMACAMAGMPGEHHKFLMDGVGTWTGTSTMWMAPGMPPMQSPSTCTITAEMDGRYTRCEYKGEIPGMGAFSGLGYNGYDNVSGKYVSTWIDNHSSGIMNGTGEMSADGTTITWTFTYNCPIAKKPATMREIDRRTGPNSMTLEMYGADPKSGKEFQMMKIELTRATKAGS